MTKTQLPRSGVSQWSAGTDIWPGRAGIDADFASLDGAMALWAQGTTAARPAAGKSGRYYWASDSLRLWYDNGTAWTEVSPVGGGGAPTTLAVAAAGAEGSSRIAARADHTHGFPVPAADPASVVYGGAVNRGAATTAARADHTHVLSLAGAQVFDTGPIQRYRSQIFPGARALPANTWQTLTSTTVAWTADRAGFALCRAYADLIPPTGVPDSQTIEIRFTGDAESDGQMLYGPGRGMPTAESMYRTTPGGAITLQTDGLSFYGGSYNVVSIRYHIWSNAVLS
jgi:hypothetical protein